MRRDGLLKALARLSVETGSLACLGCGHEHNCAIHGCAILRAAKEALIRPVSREQVEKVWSPCNFCASAKYITGWVTAVYPLSETRQQETLAEGDFDFCPVCGRPLTDEAVEMVMERLEALKDV